MSDDTPLPQPTVKFLDNPHAPDIFADGATGVFDFQGVIRITLEVGRVNHVTSPGPINRVVIGRLAMPRDQAKAMALLILERINAVDENRAAPAQSVPPSTLIN
jgi:hypothetical protein